jgi:teichuronic acid biosynthesis glycosyltransferase TuaH
LKRLKSKYSKNVYYHPNAADLSLFSKAVEAKLKKPKELEGITKPIIGYTGQIGSRIDFELLKYVAESHRDKVVFLVGPIGDDEYKTVDLDKISNVIFAGPKKIEQLPNFLQYMDCTVIPFKRNTLTKSIYPLKINEYLSAGKAVITTNFSEDIAGFKDVVYLSNNKEEFIDNINIAIKEDSREKIEKRIQKAQENTWEARVKSFWEILDDYLEKESILKN